MKNRTQTFRGWSFCLITLLVITTVSACIPNSDDYHDLSGDYFYRNEGVHVKQIICHLPNRGEIYSEVIGYNYDLNFIIVAQKPIYSDYRQMIGFNLRDNLKKYPKND